MTTVTEGVEIVDEVGHPAVQMVADIYHMLRENEFADAIRLAGKRVCHCHIAEREKRTPPGQIGDDFRSYFAALKSIAYKGLITIECTWPKNLDKVRALQKARKVMAEQWTSA